MLTYAIYTHTYMLTYADVCYIYAGERSKMRTYADVCGRMRTYTDVCYIYAGERSKMLRIEINNMTSSLRTVTLRHGDMSASCCGVKVLYTLTYADVC
jgi:hypothetical protein